MQNEKRKPSEADAQPGEPTERAANTPEADDIAELDGDRADGAAPQTGDQLPIVPEEEQSPT